MDEVLQKSLYEVFSTILTLVTTVLIPYLAVLVRSWAKAKISAIKDENLRNGIEFAFDRLDKTAETVVREIEQVLKQKLDGKVIKPEVLLHNAMTRTWRRLPAAATETLNKNFNSEEIQRIVRGKVESKVKPNRC
jgi:hypothetical protein